MLCNLLSGIIMRGLIRFQHYEKVLLIMFPPSIIVNQPGMHLLVELKWLFHQLHLVVNYFSFMV